MNNRYYIIKVKQFLLQAKKLWKEFGIKVAFYDILKNFIFRSNNTKLGKLIYRKKYEHIKKILKIKNKKIIEKYKNININENNIDKKSPIWFFWYQGLDDNTPEVVKLSWKSINYYKGEHSVILLTKDTIEKYIKLPKYYWEKLEQGTFNLTHFSDILRIELLAQYGGIWMDATIVLNDVLPKEMYDLQLFSIKHKKYSDWHICKGLWTGFFIACSKENEMMLFMRDLFREYWSKENVLIAYLLIDCCIALGYENIAAIKRIIDNIPDNNENVFYLDDYGNDVYSEINFKESMGNTSISKLHYKRSFFKVSNKGQLTNYGYISKLVE